MRGREREGGGEEGQRILKEAGIPFETSLEMAAEKAVEISK